MNKKLTFFLCAVFLFAAQSWGQTLNLTPTMTAVLDNNGVLTISTTKAEGEAMPDGSASIKNWTVRSVVIKDKVTSIGTYNFYNLTDLISVTISNSVTSIGEGAFYLCPNLSSVTIPNSVVLIGADAFASCSSLTTVNIPTSVTVMGEQVFAGCTSLNSVTIPNSVTSIADWTFEGCSSLTSVNIPNFVTSIGVGAFISTGLTSITFPNTLETIGDEAFAQCFYLTTITIPNSVKVIGAQAFWNCNGLTSVTIPSSVTSIGEQAFLWCYNLSDINVDANNPNYSSIDGVLYNKNQAILYSYPIMKDRSVFTIPTSVTNISFGAFAGCYYLSSIVIPNSVTSIGEYAFAECYFKDITVNWIKPLAVPATLFNNTNTAVAILHVPAGTKSLYQAANVWKDFGTIVETNSVVPDETQTVGADGKGIIELNLSIPSDVTLTGSFEITFPAGMTLDEQLTALSAGLSNSSFLSFTYEDNNTWLVEIKSNLLKSSTDTEYTKIMDIAYTVNDSIGMGTYKATIKNLDLLLDDGTSIVADSLSASITVERWGTAIENIGNTSFHACYINNSLRIESPQAETITIYSAAGVQLYSTKKSAGSIDAPILSLPGSVYIVKGSKSGTIKVVR